MKQNCWEFKKCGRDSSKELGICPAVTELRADGANKGTNGGRICWAIAETYCNGIQQGTYAEKVLMCRACDFRWLVHEEEGAAFQPIFFKTVYAGIIAS
jgi:hypothetical protein